MLICFASSLDENSLCLNFYMLDGGFRRMFDY